MLAARTLLLSLGLATTVASGGCGPTDVTRDDDDVALVDGPVVEVSTDNDSEPHLLDFGLVLLGESAVAEVTVTNTGVLVLQVQDLVLTNFSVFAITNREEVAAILEPNESTSLQVRFRPDTAALIEANLVIATNDTETPEVVVSLQGEGGE